MTVPLASTFQSSATPAKRRREPVSRPFSIRLSEAERRRLEGEAGALALGTYVRSRLLDHAARRQTSASASDRSLLSQILGKFGRLRLASSLSDLSAAAEVGAVVMTPDIEEEIRSACRDIRDIRSMLMHALGLKPEALS